MGEIESIAELPGGERVHRQSPRAPAEQVRATPAQLASARPGQREAPGPRLDQAVHLVKQSGQALDFVDHDPVGSLGQGERLQPVRVSEQFPADAEIEQVDGECVRQSLAEQGRLARFAWSKEKEAVVRPELQRSGRPIAISTRIMATSMPKAPGDELRAA
jgi:hypothetical protein